MRVLRCSRVSYLVQRPPHIDWTALYDLIDDIRDGLHEVRVSELKHTIIQCQEARWVLRVLSSVQITSV